MNQESPRLQAGECQHQIRANKWWEIIFSAYWMISSYSKVFGDLNQGRALSDANISDRKSIADFSLHQQWSDKQGWKATLNNFRLIVQPTILFWMMVRTFL